MSINIHLLPSGFWLSKLVRPIMMASAPSFVLATRRIVSTAGAGLMTRRVSIVPARTVVRAGRLVHQQKALGGGKMVCRTMMMASQPGAASEAEKFKADLLRCVQEGDSKRSLQLLEEMKKKDVEISSQRQGGVLITCKSPDKTIRCAVK